MPVAAGVMDEEAEHILMKTSSVGISFSLPVLAQLEQVGTSRTVNMRNPHKHVTSKLTSFL